MMIGLLFVFSYYYLLWAAAAAEAAAEIFQGLAQLKVRAKGTSYPKGIKIEPKMAELQRFKGSKSYLLQTDQPTNWPTGGS